MKPVLATLVAALFIPTLALGHATLEQQQAVSGSYQKLTLKISHGCDGNATTRVRVQIPDGVTGVKTMMKPGWKTDVVKGRYANPIDDGHGKKITEGVKEVVWSGGRLPDDNYDEFVMHVKLPEKANETLYFPTVQDCTKGVHRWIEVPEAGKSSRDYKEPAPALRLVPKSNPF